MLGLSFDGIKGSDRFRAQRIAEIVGFGVPQELKNIPHWVLWGYESRPDEKNGGFKDTKVPKNPRGWSCDKTDPKNWQKFSVALGFLSILGDRPNGHEGQETYNQFDGLGFILSDEDTPDGRHVFAIDLDHCVNRETGVISPWAAEIVAAFDTYTETTPGGDGLRIIGYGRKPGPRCRIKSMPGFELYDRAKFVTITGRKIEGRPREIRDCQAELDTLYFQVFGESDSSNPGRTAGSGANPNPSSSFNPSPIPKVQSQSVPPNISDEYVLDRIRRSKQGVRFSRLWAGDISEFLPSEKLGGHSSADFSLCSILVSWFGPDFAKIEQVFSQSGLNREKWQSRADYRESTIRKAIAGCNWFYDWSGGASRHPAASCGANPEPPCAPAKKSCGCQHEIECGHAGIHPAEDRFRLGSVVNELPNRSPAIEFLNEELQIPIPTLSPRFSRCRRIKVAMYRATNRACKRISGFSCKGHQCEHCGPIWEAERIEWFSQILAYWPEIHSIVCDSEQVANRLYQRINRKRVKGEIALYIRITMSSGKVLMLTTEAVDGSELISLEKAIEALKYAIPDIPKGKKVNCSRCLAFNNRDKQQEKTGDWKRERIQGPITRVSIEQIRQAVIDCGYWPHMEDLKQYERLNMDFQVFAGEEDTAWKDILQKLFGPNFDTEYETHVGPKYGGHAERQQYVMQDAGSIATDSEPPDEEPF